MVPVVPFEIAFETQKANLEDQCVSDSLHVTNKGKKDYYIQVEIEQNPKYQLIPVPESGRIKKGKTLEIKFLLRTFCTTVAHHLIRMAIYDTWSTKMKPPPIGEIYLSCKFESALSRSIDFDEVVLFGKLAVGGFGSVWKAKWRNTDCAVKVLAEKTDDMDLEDVKVIRKEILVCLALNHPHIVTFMGASVTVGQPITILMEYVVYGSLTKLLKDNIPSIKFKTKLALDVAKGIAFLHSSHIYHRDIKPDNVLVVSDDPNTPVNLKITDFGTANTTLTRTSNRMDPTYSGLSNAPTGKDEDDESSATGTLVYSAPEVFSPNLQYPVDKTDVYSFAVLLLQIFTQKVPFTEHPFDQFSKWDIQRFVRNGKRLDIPDDLEPSLKNLIRRCWAQTPKERPDFSEIVNELEKILHACKGSMTIEPKPQPPITIESFSSIEHWNKNVGWSGSISRAQAEAKLKDKPLGTFLLRWSENSQSCVLSFVTEAGFEHIGGIKPEDNHTIIVDQSDSKIVSIQKYQCIYHCYERSEKDFGTIVKRRKYFKIRD
eukprot:TRINITY_DN4967_c0_g1_i1.p1 TRINITY_DN4967_c0_g1~~TRINITY_DN4967_c0_g1_i1.p1  ORF type:complete len:590 (-),score=106.56 TRINITY_DN4967_c0_g1_i1:129-1757(-)